MANHGVESTNASANQNAAFRDLLQDAFFERFFCNVKNVSFQLNLNVHFPANQNAPFLSTNRSIITGQGLSAIISPFS
jgi:hypothetical protein